MIHNPHSTFKFNTSRLIFLILILVLSLLGGFQVALAQSDDDSQPKVQELSGLLTADTVAVYRLLNLKEGQRLYVRMENTIGNLDPFLMLFSDETSPKDINTQLTTAIDQVIAEGGDPLATLPQRVQTPIARAKCNVGAIFLTCQASATTSDATRPGPISSSGRR